ncbi:MAG: DUF3883 domain-containing protein, partial [Armatimonadetes bacterium]|nr:DUF3883 domain-containing protein [Armatimonadota bacterium]
DPGEELRVLLFLEHSIQSGRTRRDGTRWVVSRQMQFLELDEPGRIRAAGYAPYLDYRPLTAEELPLVEPLLEADWLRKGLEPRALEYAITTLAPQHLDEVRKRQHDRINRTWAAVYERLMKEIAYWDHRAAELRLQESVGKENARLNSGLARQREQELRVRLQRREQELEQERRLSANTPVVLGGALVVPAGLLARRKGERPAAPDQFARETQRVERLAMQAVMETERRLGCVPRDVSRENAGYDVESDPDNQGRLRFLEVKGRIQGATTVTLTRNELLTALNKPDDWILALVTVPPGPESPDGEGFPGLDHPVPVGFPEGCVVRYLRRPFQHEPDFAVTSVNYNLPELLAGAEEPA